MRYLMNQVVVCSERPVSQHPPLGYSTLLFDHLFRLHIDANGGPRVALVEVALLPINPNRSVRSLFL
jgi:hypothetical protein